jgi:hypothetical protein
MPLALAASIAGLLLARRRGIALRLRDALPSAVFFALFAAGHRAAGLHVSWSIGRSQPIYQAETAAISFLAAAAAAWTARRERVLEESIAMLVLYGTFYAGSLALLGFDYRALPSPFVSFGFLMAVTALFYFGLYSAWRLLVVDGWATRRRKIGLTAVLVVLFAGPFILDEALPRGSGVVGTFAP